MTARSEALIAFAIAPVAAIIGSLLFGAFLGHRSDYLGHFIAGFGATLMLLAYAVAFTSAKVGPRAIPLVTVVVVIVSIGLGAIAEATLFRLAQFDTIDFFNQSLGAVMAGCVAVAARFGEQRGGVALYAVTAGWLVVAVVSIAAGFHFAFA